MSDIPQVDEAAFDAQVLKSTLPVMVDFTAIWCGPCKMLEPVVVQLLPGLEWQGEVRQAGHGRLQQSRGEVWGYGSTDFDLVRRWQSGTAGEWLPAEGSHRLEI